MKRLLATAIALSTLGTVPVQAGSVWLLMREITMTGLAIEKIEMESMEQCEIQGAIYISTKRLGERRLPGLGFECLEGK